MKIICNKNEPPLGGAIAAHYVKTLKNLPIEIQWGNETAVHSSKKKISCKSNNDFLRAIGREFASKELYGATPIERVQIENWLTTALSLSSHTTSFSTIIAVTDRTLETFSFLVGEKLTLADFALFSALYESKEWQDLILKTPTNTVRWFNFIKSNPACTTVFETMPAESKRVLQSKSRDKKSPENSNVGNRAREGKFVDLPGAEMGKVVVRFPPEASGYLHIGHAKAALLNQYYQEAFQGKLIMRFDDTNPAKENPHFEKVILEDIELLELKPDMFTHTSQYFDLMLEFCEKLMKNGDAYVDDTDAETMKAQREQKVESVNRNNTFEQNFKLWEEMKRGTEKGQQCCVRAKIDMESLNGCMRDPTIYRCKNEPHPRTGDKYKVYPTYDFACPIVDSIEGVTHVLRTMEYHDRDPQFFWFIEKLGLRKPHIYEYSRLSMTNTVLSKRKLTWFVDEGLVDGWDDPRMPTVRGVLRRGMTVKGLKEFIIAQGSSRSVVFMEWDKIWAFNKKTIDPIASRFTAIDSNSPVVINIAGVKEECISVPKHPKNNEIGNKNVWLGPKILIDRVDAETLEENTKATFINWGNMLIKKINRENGVITSIDAEPKLDDTDYKKTVKLTWLADTDSAKFTPTWCMYFEHLLSKPLLGKDEDFKEFVGHKTRRQVQMLGDPELKNLKEGDIIQLQRRGFFRVDVSYKPLSLFSCRERAVVLIYIPDGHVTNTSVPSSKKAAAKAPPPSAAAKVVSPSTCAKKKDKSDPSKDEARMKKIDSNADKGDSDTIPKKPSSKTEKHDSNVAKSKKSSPKVDKRDSDDAKKPSPTPNKDDSHNGKLKESSPKVEKPEDNGAKPKKPSPTPNKDNSKVGKPKEPSRKSDKPDGKGAKPKKDDSKTNKDDAKSKKISRLGLEALKEENLSEWYTQVITKAELIEYYDVSGCYILRPWAYSIWEAIKNWFDAEIKKLGVQNCYFPIFVSKSVLEKEKDHIADFAPEVAWVTKSGDSDLAEPIAVRPTSETVMYPAYAKWIQSYRDLPIKLNQWNNVVRWEFKHPQPFLRTREFLWQEGHTAYASKEDACTEVEQILALYEKIYRMLLAIPVLKGRKTEKEKFAGGEYTLTVEAYIAASGRGIQGATSHHLGQNFSKMFDVVYEDPETQEKKYVYQNSWGITTRTIGVMVMTHGDNKGLILPPPVASIQVILIPCGITAGLDLTNRNEILDIIQDLEMKLKEGGIRAKGDCRLNYSPGWKFNHWELKGVPLRLEIGPVDIAKGVVAAVRRHDGIRQEIPRHERIVDDIKVLLDEIHEQLYQRAGYTLLNKSTHAYDWDSFKQKLEDKCIIYSPFCGEIACEDRIKADSARDDGDAAESGAPAMGAKTLCIPLIPPLNLREKDVCIYPDCKNPPKYITLFGRSY